MQTCDQVFNADLREFDPQVKQVASFITLNDILSYETQDEKFVSSTESEFFGDDDAI